MPFSWFVALRYLKEGRMQTALILLGVSVGVGVIIFLAALIDGLQSNLIEKTLGSQPHIVVRPQEEIPRILTQSGDPAASVRLEKPAQRLRSINQWQLVAGQIARIPGVTAVSPVVSGAAFAVRGEASKSIALRGCDPELSDRMVSISRHIRQGEYRLTGMDALIGTELAKNLGLRVGDKLRVVAPDARDAVFTVSGIFDLENKEVNERWVLVSMRPAQTLLDLAGGVTSIEATVGDVFQAETIAQRIASGTGLIADSWMIQNAQLLTGLRSQNSSRYMIQTFVIIAVALGIASVLVVWVVQKNREIGILRAMGTPRRMVMRVFLIQGALLGIGGWVMGSLLGTGLSLFFVMLARNPDGSPTFPVDLNARLFLGTAQIGRAHV
jgi:lipoprotein-releasing system permease protein